ncbi:hypothetical protein [Caudoviricetes sp.]|nr:hypothetical protein [Caudoviricetes sp.]
MITKPSPILTDIRVTLTQVGTVLIGDPTPVITRKSLYDITYDERFVASTLTLPIYSINPTPASVEITNIGGAKEGPRAWFDGANLHITSPGEVYLDFQFILQGGQKYNVGKIINPSVGTNSSTSRTFVSYNANSLAKHISESFSSLQTGDPAIRRNLFSTFNQNTLTFGRNISCFLHDVYGIEAYPVSNNSAAYMMNGMAFSRRHILSVAHTGSQLGQTLYFLKRNNTVITRTVIDTIRLSGGSDQTIGVLDERLPSDFELPQLLVGAYDYLPEYSVVNLTGSSDISVPSLRLLPIVVFNQDRFPAINYMSGLYTNNVYYPAFNYSPNQTDDIVPTAWQQKVRAGDSGSPTCTIINNRLTVLGSNGTIFGGIAVGEASTALQEAMDALCLRNGFSNETFATADLSAFDTYP